MIDELPDELDPAPSPVKRPGGLTVICIFTFIFSGLSSISFLFCSLYYTYLPELIKNSPFSKDVPGIDALTHASIWFYILNAILYGISLSGAIVMFRLRKVGFHLYTVSQILLLIIPLVYMPGFKSDFSNITITTVFILIYASHLRIMK